MNRFAPKSLIEVLVLLIAFGVARPQRAHARPQAGAAGPAEKPCAFLTKAEAESILGRTVVMRSDAASECWFVQEGFTGGTGPNSKQIHLSISRSASPKADDVTRTRAYIANDHTAQYAVKDVAGIGDAALWSWIPGWGRLDAFKGGTVQVQVVIGGLPENAALDYAKKLAARPLGAAGGSHYAYDGASKADAEKIRGAAAIAQSPAAYRDTWRGQTRIVRGTVSRVEMASSGYPKWLTIYFKESPDGAFVACSPYPDMFAETVGDLYRLVGKTLQVTGPVGSAMCAGKGASINVVESAGYHVENLPAASVAVAAGSVPFRNTNGPRLGLDICNAGQATFDAVVAKQGRATLTRISPAQCGHVYEDTSGPASVGFAFTDSRGQSVPASRVDWRAPSSEIWGKGGGQNLSVRRGNLNVVVPAQMLFHPPSATCHTNSVDSTSPWNQVGPGSTPAQIREAQRQEAASVPTATTTVCDNTEYDLNVVAYPDTREVTFYKKCYACPPTSSPAAQAQSRAGLQQTTATMSKASPLAGGIMAGVIAGAQQSALKESLEGPPEYRLMSWDELNRVPARPPGGGRPAQMPPYFAMRGTVSRVELRPAPSGINETGPWVNVYFRESTEQATGAFGTSYGAFNVCTFGTEIFEGMFGPDFRTRMIGQVLEVEGEYGKGCMGWKGGIRIELAHQVRKVK
jgi:hypothetical protein